MSEATKRKYVAQEILTDFPEPAPPQKIAQILASRGGNLHEYLDQDGLKAICSMPSKFRKNVWIKRGDFVILDPISEGDKVKSEITSILYADQIRHLKKCSLWPEAFEKVDVDGPKYDLNFCFFASRPITDHPAPETHSFIAPTGKQIRTRWSCLRATKRRKRKRKRKMAETTSCTSTSPGTMQS
eukprot:m.871284 g.871284  ORF g.871284 m.871284 type:complete len:185 (-) comp59761_c1_seq6:4113-4667(-)